MLEVLKIDLNSFDFYGSWDLTENLEMGELLEGEGWSTWILSRPFLGYTSRLHF